MDAATIILLSKIATDLIVTIGLAIPKVTGLSDDEKKAMLLNLQENTTKLMAALTAMAAK